MSSRDLLHAQQYAMIDDYLIDCLLSDEHEYEAEITEYPVESGSTITDNIRPKPLTITMECLVTNTPIGPLALIRDPASAGSATFATANTGVNADQLANANSRETSQPPVGDAYNRMLEIRDRREPVTIRTSLGTFQNMAMKSLSIPRASGRGDDLKFTASFQQIKIVKRKRSVIVQTHRGNCTGSRGKPKAYLWRQATPAGGPWHGAVYNSEGRQILSNSLGYRGSDPAVWVLYTPDNPMSTRWEYLDRIAQKGNRSTSYASVFVSTASDTTAALTAAEQVRFHFDMRRDAMQREAEAGKPVSLREYDKLRAANKLQKADEAARAAENQRVYGRSGNPILTKGPATGTKPPNVSLGKPTRMR